MEILQRMKDISYQLDVIDHRFEDYKSQYEKDKFALLSELRSLAASSNVNPFYFTDVNANSNNSRSEEIAEVTKKIEKERKKASKLRKVLKKHKIREAREKVSEKTKRASPVNDWKGTKDRMDEDEQQYCCYKCNGLYTISEHLKTYKFFNSESKDYRSYVKRWNRERETIANLIKGRNQWVCHPCKELMKDQIEDFSEDKDPKVMIPPTPSTLPSNNNNNDDDDEEEINANLVQYLVDDLTRFNNEKSNSDPVINEQEEGEISESDVEIDEGKSSKVRRRSQRNLENNEKRIKIKQEKCN